MWLGIVAILVVFLAVLDPPWRGRANRCILNGADASQIMTKDRLGEVIGHSRTSRGMAALEADLQQV
jgi:hypothetical protein